MESKVSIIIDGIQYDAVFLAWKRSCADTCDLYHVCESRFPGMSSFCNGLDSPVGFYFFKKSDKKLNDERNVCPVSAIGEAEG